jgi:NAD(P)-dependent dehydrogenase (short-subunit alcohol dehydrogenase family)
MPSVLIIGATRGLGASLAKLYAADPKNIVYGTTRKESAPSAEDLSKRITWLRNIDVSKEDVGDRTVKDLVKHRDNSGTNERSLTLDVVV